MLVVMYLAPCMVIRQRRWMQCCNNLCRRANSVPSKSPSSKRPSVVAAAAAVAAAAVEEAATVEAAAVVTIKVVVVAAAVVVSRRIAMVGRLPGVGRKKPRRDLRATKEGAITMIIATRWRIATRTGAAHLY
jgi:hypothetical protein